MQQRFLLASGLGLGLSIFAVYFPGCTAGTSDVGNGGQGAASPTTTTETGTADNSSASEGVVVSTSSGFVEQDAGMDAPPDVPVNPCGTECSPPGTPDKCDGIFRGLDDNCNGTVDEGCPCTSGEVTSCFKGDPSYIDEPGCAPGSQVCNELGQWGDCIGGQHATDGCFNSPLDGCHAINALPFETVHLENGTGNFDDNADVGSEVWEVACPMGVMPCPAPVNTVNGADVQVLVSGEYSVTYTKTVAGTTETCTYPLYVGARGLRVELSWNYPGSGADLDLHVHEPVNTMPWDTGSPGSNNDCGWGNCDIDTGSPFNYSPPEWFPMVAPFGDPVAWYKDPLLQANTCYFAPRGKGAAWQQVNQGCHNPRLDLDNISCTPSETDPSSTSFCAPENINIDFPPKNTWIRVAVRAFTVSNPDIRPVVKLFCDGALAGEFGPQGFNAPISWSSADDDVVWSVADIAFKEDQCVKQCVVKPIYLNDDAVAKMPYYQDLADAESVFTPPYPPAP